MKRRTWTRTGAWWAWAAVLPLWGQGPLATGHVAAPSAAALLQGAAPPTSRAEDSPQETGRTQAMPPGAPGPQPEEGDRMKKPLRIVALGDSITNGTGLAGTTEAETFRALVERELAKKLQRPVEVINAGVNGDIVTQALRRLERDVLSKNPDLVTVMFGGNEAGFYRPETRGFADTPRVERKAFSAALAEIVQRIRAAGSRVVLMTCPPMTERYWGMHLEPYQEHGINFLVKDYAQAMRDVARAANVELIDVYRAVEANPAAKDYFPDGLHPDPRGHRLIADLLIERLPGILQRAGGGKKK